MIRNSILIFMLYLTDNNCFMINVYMYFNVNRDLHMLFIVK